MSDEVSGMDIDFITDDLRSLRDLFNQRGFDLRLVGGVVRDTLAGIPAKDIDLCTDADPAQQIGIYRDHGYRWIETGLQHGTVTVVMNGVPYEITSLRIDVETDGRHAEVEFTNDWTADLARRDLTINAMAMTFDGELIDPFGGADDLACGVVRFVGDPVQRIQEDYLRILRWIRFDGRFGQQPADPTTRDAIHANAHGLKGISRERIWSEVRRIVPQPTGAARLDRTHSWCIPTYIGLGQDWSASHLYREAVEVTQCPELLISAGFRWDAEAISRIAAEWRWSNAERDHALWMAEHIHRQPDLRYLLAVEGAPRDWVVELAALEGRDGWERNGLAQWVFEPIPVTGHDLMAKGVMQGKHMGAMLRDLRERWAQGGYTATKEELLAAWG